MNRIVQSILGVLAVLAGLALAVPLILGTPPTWIHVVLILALVGAGAHFISNTLATQLVAGAIAAVKGIHGAGTPPTP